MNEPQVRTSTLLACAICAVSLAFANSVNAQQASAAIEVSDADFGCVNDMTRIRHFFVDNLLGDLEGTLKIAQSPTGGTFPEGSVVQLVPEEVMVKHKPGFNAETGDWEFFALDVSQGTTSIQMRGGVDVINGNDRNCFECHSKANPEWDFICGKDHGCDPVMSTREQFAERQKDDPRCK